MISSTFFLATSSDWTSYAILICRLFIGVCFIIHGLGKLGVVGSGNMEGFVAWLSSLKVPAPAIQARLAMAFEILGGTFITMGLFMRLGCLMCLTTMVVAALIGHRGGGYLITNNPPGREYAINLAIICIVLFLLGPGELSIDAHLFF